MLKKPFLIIDIKSYSKKYENYILRLKRIFNSFNVKYGIVRLPKKRKKITLLKSPHVNKKAREQFELITYKISIYLYSKLNLNNLKYLVANKPGEIKLNIRKII